MDPLSIATAVVTFVEVAGSVGKGIKLLRSVARSDVEFCDLLNELEILHSFMEQVVQTVSDLSRSGTGASATSLQRLERLHLELSRTADELDVLAGDLDTASRPNKKGVKKVPVIQWQRHKSRALALRAQCRRSREDIRAFLDVLGPSLNAVNHARMMIKIEGLSISTTESIKQATDDAARQVVERIDNLEAAFSSIVHITSTPFHGRPSSGDAARGQRSARLRERRTDRGGSNLASVHATIAQRCPSGCGCQCHTVSQLNTPTWLRYALGGCLLRYNAIPVFGRRPCNAAQCRAGPERSMRLTVNFPRWLLRRALQCTASWDALNMGAKTSVIIPRVVCSRDLFSAMVAGNLEWLRSAFRKKRYLPTDLNESDGGPLLLYLLRGLPTALELLSPFVTDRVLSVCDANGLCSSVADSTRILIWQHKDLFSRARCTLESVVELGSDHLTYSPSPIRDSILGNSGISLKQALVMGPDSLNSLDSYGYSPLHWAVCRNDAGAALFLLQHGADPNLPTKSEGYAPLHLACQFESLATASLLLQHEVNVNAKDRIGWPPLSYGLLCPDLVYLLLKHGAEPGLAEERSLTPSPLHLLSHPLIGPKSSEALSKVLPALIDVGANLEHVDSYGNTPLLWAASMNRAGVMGALAECGARIDAANDFGDTILTITVRQAHSSSQIQFLRDRIDIQLDPDARGSEKMSLLDWIHCRTRFAIPWADKFARRSLTHLGVFLISALVVELRERNWANGRFLETRDQVHGDGSHRDLKRWLGREYLRMQYQPGFADEVWDKLAYPSYWYYHQDDDLDERELWYEATEGGGAVFRCLFGEEEAEGDEYMDGPSDSEGEDEFYDAMDV
ncbi:hypothetical protein RB599_000267 [Gaeumannomyces hyphopodioides]